MASAISLRTVSISDSASFLKYGWPTVAIPTSISFALKSLETTVERVLIAVSIAYFLLH